MVPQVAKDGYARYQARGQGHLRAATGGPILQFQSGLEPLNEARVPLPPPLDPGQMPGADFAAL